jgi:hypothetical protein
MTAPNMGGPATQPFGPERKEDFTTLLKFHSLAMNRPGWIQSNNGAGRILQRQSALRKLTRIDVRQD